MSENLEIYNLLGWDLTKSGSQLLGTCPFCTKKKMYVDPQRTTYHCKVCGEKGNNITVIGAMFDHVYREAIPLKELKALAADRGLPIGAMLLDENLGYDEASKKFVWSVRKPDGTPVSIRRAQKRGGKYNIRALKGTKLGILGAEYMPEDKAVPIYIVEGEWDRISLLYILNRTRQKGVVHAVPGAGNFNKEWAQYYRGRHVRIVYDNDQPGREGCKRTAKFLRPICKSVRFVHWPSEFPEGFDINDLLRANTERVQECYEQLTDEGHLRLYAPGESESQGGEDPDAEAADQESLTPISVEELHATFHKWLHLENCDLLDVVMGVLWSIHFPGNPLWFLVVSPPSGSKSETLMPVSEWYRCHALSTITAKSLISGFQTAGGGDPSLFAELDSSLGAIIVKDLTPLLQARESERDEVFGILRDAYDGTAKKIFGNGVVRDYRKLHFSMICGVTPAIDSHDSVSMGERFLKFRADKELDREDDIERAMRAIMNTGSEGEMKEELKQACIRSLVRKIDPATAPTPDKRFVKLISELAVLCARMRAVAPSDRFSDIQTMSPLSEAPPRLASQFSKFARGLALHFEATSLCDERILKLIRRVVIHTPDIITVRIMRALYDNYEHEGRTISGLMPSCKGLSRETLRTVLIKLSRTGTCHVMRPIDGDRSTLFQLDEKVYDIIKRHSLFDNLPKNDPLYRGKRLVLKKKGEK